MSDGPVVLLTTTAALHHPRHYNLMARGLERAGVNTVVAGQPDRRPQPAGPVPVFELPRRRGRARRLASGPLAIRQVSRLKPSVLQVTSIDLLPWAVIAKRLLRIPVLYDSCEDYAAYMLIKEWLPPWLRRALARLVSVVEPALARTLDATTVADPATAEKFSGSARPVLVVHNFPWRELGDTEPAAEPRFDVTYHGSLPGYHVDHIVAVARLLRERGHDVSWCLAALSYGEADQRRLERRLEEAGVREQFTLMYNLTAAEIPALLADTRLGFIPLPDVEKFRRNLPMKLFEFMSLGRPAVISDLPPVRRIAGLDECALLVQPGDDEAYADALERLLIDPELAAGMGARGKRLIAERLNADVELRDYVALCTRLSSNGSRP